jgi:hypothetical protein
MLSPFIDNACTTKTCAGAANKIANDRRKKDWDWEKIGKRNVAASRISLAKGRNTTLRSEDGRPKRRNRILARPTFALPSYGFEPNREVLCSLDESAAFLLRIAVSC